MSHGPQEFEYEPVRGLPETLPPGEIILWQGASRGWGLARRAFHLRKLTLYFGVILLLRLAFSLQAGATWVEVLPSLVGLSGLAGVSLGLLGLVAWLNARASVYTITNRRVVLRIGVALVVALNLPFRQIRAVEIRRHADGTGDLALELEAPCDLGYLMLWPHARPWRTGKRAQPMLRSVPRVDEVGEVLSRALADADEAHRVERPLDGPAPAPEPAPVSNGITPAVAGLAGRA